MPASPAPCLSLLLRQLDQLAPGRRRNYDGIMRDPRVGPPSDHHQGNAIDVTQDPGASCDVGVLAAELVRQMRLAPVTGRLTYVIWNHRIASGSRGWIWRPYGRSCPHIRHIHISIKPTHRDVIRPWTLRLK